MSKRLLFLFAIGVAIIGGAIASALVEVDCPQCIAGVVDCPACRTLVRCPRCGSGVIAPDCPVCYGLGITVKSLGAFINYLEVECGCSGKNPDCPNCDGKGWYLSFTTGMCEVCQGKGGRPCPYCGGDGKIQLREKALRFLKR